MRCEAIKKSDGKRCTASAAKKTSLGHFCNRHSTKSSRNGVYKSSKNKTKKKTSTRKPSSTTRTRKPSSTTRTRKPSSTTRTRKPSSTTRTRKPSMERPSGYGYLEGIGSIFKEGKTSSSSRSSSSRSSSSRSSRPTRPTRPTRPAKPSSTKHHLERNELTRNRNRQATIGRRLKGNYRKVHPVGVALDFSRANCLLDIFSILNAHYFNNRLKSSVCWALLPKNTGGEYHPLTNHISLNSEMLKEAPIEVVAFVLYHEMLHEDIPAYKDHRGCQIIHGPEFKRREKMFPYYNLGNKFLKEYSEERARSGSIKKVGKWSVGDKFISTDGKINTIVGFRLKAKKYPIVIKNERGTQYVVGPSYIDRKISRNPQEERGLTVDDINDISCPLDYHEIPSLQNDVIFD